jgi:hypothetical protein
MQEMQEAILASHALDARTCPHPPTPPHTGPFPEHARNIALMVYLLTEHKICAGLFHPLPLLERLSPLPLPPPSCSGKISQTNKEIWRSQTFMRGTSVRTTPFARILRTQDQRKIASPGTSAPHQGTPPQRHATFMQRAYRAYRSSPVRPLMSPSVGCLLSAARCLLSAARCAHEPSIKYP